MYQAQQQQQQQQQQAATNSLQGGLSRSLAKLLPKGPGMSITPACTPLGERRTDCAACTVTLYMGDKSARPSPPPPPSCTPATPSHTHWSTCTGDHVLFQEDVLVRVTQKIMQKN